MRLKVYLAFLLAALVRANQVSALQCSNGSAAAWGTSYQSMWSLAMPPYTFIDHIVGRPPGVVTVENHLMYVKVRDNPLYGWGNAGLQVINMTSGTWAGTILSPVAPYQSSHTQTTAIALRSLQSNGPLNRHTAFLTLRAPNGTSYLHAATLESSGSVVTPHNNVSMPALRWAWVSEVATGEIVTDPALFDSLDPEGSLEPNGSLGYLALTSNRRLYVYNATSGALLYAHEVPGRGLLPPTSRANIVPLNFKGLAVFPTANATVIAFNLATRTVEWEVQLPTPFIATLQASQDRLVVRVSKGPSGAWKPFYSISRAAQVSAYDPDPSMSFAFRIDNPYTPISPDGTQILLLPHEGNDTGPPPRPRRLGAVDLQSTQQTTVKLQFQTRVEPMPAAMVYDSCRVVITTTGLPYESNDVVTSIYVADVATGALIWGKDLMPSVDDTGDDFIMLPHVDPVTGSIYQLRNNEMWRMDPVPAKPTPPPPSPSRPPSPPLPPSPPPLPPSPTRPPTPPSSPPQPDMPQQPPMYPNGNPPLVRQPTSSQDPALRPPPPSPGSAVRQGVATWLLGVALGTQLLLLILAA